MLTQTSKLLTSDEIAARIRSLREDWENAAVEDSRTLIEVRTSVGMLLLDMADALGLTGENRLQALGEYLVRMEAQL